MCAVQEIFTVYCADDVIGARALKERPPVLFLQERVPSLAAPALMEGTWAKMERGRRLCLQVSVT